MKFLKAMLVSMFVTLFVGGGGFAAAVYFGLLPNPMRQTVPVFIEVRDTSLRKAEKPAPPVHVYIIDDEDLPCPYTVTILISAAGDVTLGGDNRWRGYHAFMQEFRESGYDHSIFFANVAQIFYQSDFSIVNLEGALTNITAAPADKEFLFRGPPHFAQILAYGNIDAVTLANNHTGDFGLQGYTDTQAALRDTNIMYFGNETVLLVEINGILVGFLGHRIWHDGWDNRNRVTASIERLRRYGAELIIAFHHWGVELANFPEQYQINMGRHTLRAGADLVLGAHPHVIQGIEEYNGRFIVYSLADFCFGGNANPADQDAFIFQQKFTFYRGELLPKNETNIIPVFMSSVRGRNDFRPTPAEHEDAERILERLERYSAALR